jgi:hypothetical protein
VLFSGYYLGDQIRSDERWVRHVLCMGEKGNAYRVLVGNLKERGKDLCVK